MLFSLCFHFSYKTTQHIIVVNSWRLEHDSVFSCYFRHKHVSVSFHIKEAAVENVMSGSNHVFNHLMHRTDSFLLCAFALKHVTCVATHLTPHQQVSHTSPLSTRNGLTCLMALKELWMNQIYTT